MKSSKFEVIKHSAAIHSSNTLSLVERKITNALLKNAYNDLQTKPVHQINITTLFRLIGWGQGNADNEIKNALTRLIETKVEFNIFGKDRKRVWGVTTLLSEAEIRNGVCSYAYSSMLKELLYNPNIYARLDLQIQRNFRSKYSLALWEFFVDILGAAKQHETVSDWISIDDIRRLLDVTESYYDQFFQFNQKIIKTAISEINRESDLFVSVKYLRKLRKIVALSFIIKKKDYYRALSIYDRKDAENDSDRIVDNRANKDIIINLLAKLESGFNIPSRTARRLIDSYGCDAIESDLLAVTESMKHGRIKNIAAFTIKAIEEHYGEKIKIKDTRSVSEVSQKQRNNDSVSDKGWKNVRYNLQATYGNDVFNSWFAQLDFIDKTNDTVTLNVSTAFIKGWIENNYLNKIQKLWQHEDSNITKITLMVKERKTSMES